MPTPPRRWSFRQETQRAGADAAAARVAADLEGARRLIREAQARIRANPDLATQLLAEALAAIGEAEADAERIRRLMLEASIGRE